MVTKKDCTREKSPFWSLDQSLKKLRILLKITGLNVMKEKRSKYQNILYGFNFIWLMSGIICVFSWIYKGILNGKNFIEITFVFPHVTFCVIASTKGGSIFVNENFIYNQLEILRRLEKNLLHSDFSEEEKRLLKSDIAQMNRVILLLTLLNGMMVITFPVCALVLIFVKYLTTGEIELILPFLDLYPFNTLEFGYWLIGYVHQVWSQYVTLTFILTADILFFIACTHLNIQFKQLKYQLERIISYEDASLDGQNENVDADLTRLIKWHQELISSASFLETVYSKSTLLNFLASSLVICLTGFNITVIDDTASIIAFMVFLFVSLLQIYLLCFFGGLLMNSSTEISDGAYNCKWYLNKSIGKSILIIQSRAQAPCKITAAGFADVNLRAFMRVISTSWSYFALLQTMYGSAE